MDGVKLDRLTPGRVSDVSPSLGSWLLAEGYAALEMRSSVLTTVEDDFADSPRRQFPINAARQFVHDRRQRSR